MDIEVVEQDPDARDLEEFYANGSIVAIDVCTAQAAVFEHPSVEKSVGSDGSVT